MNNAPFFPTLERLKTLLKDLGDSKAPGRDQSKTNPTDNRPQFASPQASAVDEMAVDPYGGIQALRGKATGAFHLEKVEKRNCLITPDGHGFLSLGVVHVGAIREPSKIDLFHDEYGGDWKRASEAAARNLQSWGFNRTKNQL